MAVPISVSTPVSSNSASSSPSALSSMPSRSTMKYRPSLPWEKYDSVLLPNEFASISDFLFKALNRRFLDYYDTLLTTLTTLDVDDFDAKALVRDSNYAEASQIFSAYRTYSPSCRSQLTNAMFQWCSQQQSKKTEWSDFFKESTHVKVQAKDSWWILEEKKVMLVNYLWARLTWLVFQDLDEGEPIEMPVAVRLLDYCFSRLSGHSSKLKCYEPNFLNYLKISSEILGSLSRLMPVACIERLLSEMDRLDPRNSTDLIYLFEGVKGLQLDISDPKQSADVIKLFGKFTFYTDTKQKRIPDIVRASALECFTNIMTMVACNVPGNTVSPAWISQVEEITNRLFYLIKKSKMLHLVNPLQSVFLCCCSRVTYLENYASFLESLFKYIKPGDKHRVVAFDALFRLIISSFSLFPKEDEIIDKMSRRTGRELTQNFGKGKPLAPQKEAVQLTVDIITLIAVKRLHFATNEIVLQLLKLSDKELKSTSDLNSERLIIALLSVRSIFNRLESSNFASLQAEESEGIQILKDTPVKNFRQRVLLHFKKTEDIPPPPDSLLQGCGGAMDHLFPMLDSQFGNLLVINQTKSLQDLVPHARVPQLDLLVILISTVSICLPTKMDQNTLIMMLCRYTLHLHETLKANAKAVIIDLLQNRPSLRPLILNQLCSFIQTINDANLESATSTLNFLNMLMSRWYSVVCKEVGGSSRSGIAPRIDTALLEGTFLLFLCRPEPEVRSVAYDSLRILWKLLRIIPSNLVKNPSRSVIDAILVHSNSIVRSAKKGPGFFPFDSEVFEDLKSISSSVDLSFQPVPDNMSKVMPSPAPAKNQMKPLAVNLGSQGSVAGLNIPVIQTPHLLPQPNITIFSSGNLGLESMSLTPTEAQQHLIKKQMSGRSLRSIVSILSSSKGGEWGSEEFDRYLFGKDGVGADSDRWGCILGGLLKILAVECIEASAVLFRFILAKIEAAFEALLEAERDKGTNEIGRYVIWRNYLIAAVGTCGCALSSSELQAPVATLMKQVVQITKTDIPSHAVAADFAMAYTSQGIFSEMFTAFQPFFQELVKAKKMGGKKDSLRLHLASILRSCSYAFESGPVERVEDILQSFANYLQDSYNFLVLHADSQANSLNWMILSLKYSLFSTLPRVALASFRHDPRRHETLFRLEYRRDLFNFISKFSGVGGASRSYKQLEQRQLDELCAKLKTEQERSAFKTKVMDAVALVEKFAGESMRALLSGNLFDASAIDPFGSVFDWNTCLFQSQVQVKQELGRRSVVAFIGSNTKHSSLSALLVDKSYLSDKQVSYNYFLCLCEILTRLMPVGYSLPSVLLLCLYKFGDPRPEVRRSAAQLLVFLAQTHFQSTGGYSYYVAPDADIEPSFTHSTLSLSIKLAKDRPELTYDLLEELMIRMPTLEHSGQKRIFSYFCNWGMNIDFRTSSPERTNLTLRHLFVLTLKLSHDRSDVETMWCLLAKKETNIAPILDFLFEFGVVSQNVAGLVYCKQISLYISRTSPRATVSHLVTELPSIGVRNLGLERVSRGGVANPLSWELNEILAPTTYQEPFSRSHFGLILLTNISIEQSEECAQYLPRILQFIFLAGDRRNEVITTNALMLLHNICLALISTQKSYRRFLPLLASRIQKLRSNPYFWNYEDLARDKLKLKSEETLSDYVAFVLETLSWVPSLSEDWGREALSVALGADSGHIFARSLQLYRCLKPKIVRSDVRGLIDRFKTYVQKKQPLSIGLEIIRTLKAGVQWTDRKEVITMPQFFWASVAILHSNDPIEFSDAILLLSTVLSCIEFSSSTVQSYILSGFPYEEWDPPFAGFLPLVLKGLTHRSTERVSLALISEVAMLPPGPVIDIDPKRRLLLNTLALLPHLCLFMGKDSTAEMAKGLSCMFDYSASAYLDNSSNLAEIFQKYSAQRYESTESFVDDISVELAISFFPHYELLVFSFFVELLDKGNPQYERVLLILIDCFLTHVKMDASILQAKGMAFFAPIEQRLNGLSSRESLSITRKIIMLLPPSPIQIAHAKHMNVVQRLGDFSEMALVWDDQLTSQSKENVVAALDQILTSLESAEVPVTFPEEKAVYDSFTPADMEEKPTAKRKAQHLPPLAKSPRSTALDDSSRKPLRTIQIPVNLSASTGPSSPSMGLPASPRGSKSPRSRKIPQYQPPPGPSETDEIALCFPDFQGGTLE